MIIKLGIVTMVTKAELNVRGAAELVPRINTSLGVATSIVPTYCF